MNNPMEGVNKLAQMVEGIRIDASGAQGQEVDEQKVQWYKDRFQLLVEDGVPDAINSYLKKLLKDNVNELTRAVIIHEALSIDGKERGV